LHGFSRARVTQILKLLNLHPDIICHLRKSVGFGGAPTERRLRPLTSMSPDAQRRHAERWLSRC
jgi:hypothetical protein